LKSSQFQSAAASSGYCPADLRLAPAINPSASPSNRPPTCVGVPSSALPSNSPPTLIGCPILRPALRSISSLRLRPTFRPSPPVNLRLSSTGQPSGSAFQSTCGLRRLPTFRPAFRLSSSLRLRPIFRLNPPANLFDLRLLAIRPVLPSYPTSDSPRLLHPPALPSS